MNQGRVGEDRGSKETDGCPLTRAATFAERIVRQEMRTGVMAFAD
jgi:hypothetical protein